MASMPRDFTFCWTRGIATFVCKKVSVESFVFVSVGDAPAAFAISLRAAKAGIFRRRLPFRSLRGVQCFTQ